MPVRPRLRAAAALASAGVALTAAALLANGTEATPPSPAVADSVWGVAPPAPSPSPSPDPVTLKDSVWG